MNMNVASLLGDLSHIVAIFLLLGWIVYKKSCEGISGKMQILYAIVFTTRYLDIFDLSTDYVFTFMKLFFILTTYITVLMVYVVYKKTYEREYDLFWIETLIVVCLGLGLLETYDISMPEEVLWAFSRYLEAVVIIPQLYFTYKKEVKSNIITYYVIALILYRAFYIGNWIIRYKVQNHFDPYVVYPGLIQFVVYFAYFVLPRGPPKLLPTTVDVRTPEIQVPRTPNLGRQESLLETPFLKRNAASYSSVYTVGLDSKNSSPNGSVSNLNTATNQEGRY